MLKAILYYILLIAEFMITFIIGGLALAVVIQTGYDKLHPEVIEQTASLLAIVAGLIIWGTYSHYKFSKFSLGKVQPAAKWGAMLYATLPILGFTLAFYGVMNFFHIDFMPEEMSKMNFLTLIPYTLLGSFLSAYVFYGAIQEELIRCGKKLWVQMLTLCLMMLPCCLMIVTAKGDISLHFTFLGMVSTLYACWIYNKTRSTIVLLAVYLIPNLVPSVFDSAPLSIAFFVIGLPMTILGWMTLQKKLDKMLLPEEKEGEEDNEDE